MGLRLFGASIAPDLAAGRQSPFPWDGPLRSALFPRKAILATDPDQWICDVRFPCDQKPASYES